MQAASVTARVSPIEYSSSELQSFGGFVSAIETSLVGRNRVPVSTFALGTAAIGNLFTPVAHDDAVALVTYALDSGIRHVDTAPHYGVGLAEERVGRALAARPGATYTLATKVGRLLEPLGPGETEPAEGYVQTPRRKRVWDLSADGIRRSIEDSIERLGVDRIDIAYLHDPDDHEEDARASAIPALIALRDEGLVGAVGAGMNQAEMLARFVRDFDIDVVLVAGRYTLLEQPALTELLPLCEERGVSVMVGGPFNSGLLADPRPGNTYNYEAASVDVVRRAQAIGAVCAEFNVPLTAAALQFPLAHPAVASVLTGARCVSELAANLEGFAAEVPADLWGELKARGLLALDAPVPDGSIHSRSHN
jgi:D-threo-aldose 1-dehydrogenase